MSLILCPECGSKISKKAITCPHCGFVSDDSSLPISEQDKFEIVPTFKFEIENWDSNTENRSIVSYDDNKIFFQYYGNWQNIKNTFPALAKVLKEMATKDNVLVADISPYLKKMIQLGKYKLVKDKNGKLLATLRGSKGFSKNIRLKEKNLSPDLSNSMNNLHTQMAMDQILNEIKFVGIAIGEIHVELQNDRIAMAESSRDKLLQARSIQNARLREIAVLNVVNSATDAKRVLMRNFSQNLQYINDQTNRSKIQFPRDFNGSGKIDKRASDAMMALKSITDAVQVECVGYAIIGEYESSKESLAQFKNYINDNKLNDRDTLLLINESLKSKQIEVVDRFSEIALRITNFEDTSQVDLYNYEMIDKKENENEDI